MKSNCWEVKQCGREPGGKNMSSMGVCPAATETRLEGVHGGKKAGRACWVVAGTHCGGKLQGTFASKFHDCEKCDFYNSVREEEYPEFKYSSILLARLRGDDTELVVPAASQVGTTTERV